MQGSDEKRRGLVVTVLPGGSGLMNKLVPARGGIAGVLHYSLCEVWRGSVMVPQMRPTGVGGG